MEFNSEEILRDISQSELTEDQRIDLAAARVMERFRSAFEELAT